MPSARSHRPQDRQDAQPEPLVFTEGVERVEFVRFIQTEPYMIAEVRTLETVEDESENAASSEALVRNVISQFDQIVSASKTLRRMRTIAANIEVPAKLVDFIASSLPFLTTAEKQLLLETPYVVRRLELLHQYLAKEIEVQQLRTKIQSDVQDQVQQSQRDYYLREHSRRSKRNLAKLTKVSARPMMRQKTMNPECLKRSRRKLSRSSTGFPACRRWLLITHSLAITLRGSWRCHGTKAPA